MNIKNIDFYRSNQLFSFNCINENKNISIKKNTDFFNNIVDLLKIQQKIVNILINSLKSEIFQENKISNEYLNSSNNIPKLEPNNFIATRGPVYVNSQKTKIIINKFINSSLKIIDVYKNWYSHDYVSASACPSRGGKYPIPPAYKKSYPSACPTRGGKYPIPPAYKKSYPSACPTRGNIFPRRNKSY